MLNEQTASKNYFKYWGKAQHKPNQIGTHYSLLPYHLLPYHCLDVAAVGKAVFSANQALTRDLAHFLELTEEQLTNLFCFMLALHDLGKFSSSFQKLYLSNTDDLYNPVDCADYDGKNFRHDRMGLYFWTIIQDEVLMVLTQGEDVDSRGLMRVQDTLMILADCVLGHHGQPINKNDPNAIKAFVEEHNEQAVIAFVKDILPIFNPQIALEKLASKDWQKRLKQVSWHLAGIAVVTDWIGSDSNFFHYQTEKIPLSEYWSMAQAAAQRALEATDLWQPLNVQPFSSIQKYYGFSPTPLQDWAETVVVDKTSQLFILEDVTGAGKTEAALALTHRLMAAGAAEGFYFGLPTMATSNAMFSRVAKHYQQMLSGNEGKKPSIVLAHGAREMSDLFREAVLATGITDSDYNQADQTATAQCNH